MKIGLCLKVTFKFFFLNYFTHKISLIISSHLGEYCLLGNTLILDLDFHNEMGKTGKGMGILHSVLNTQMNEFKKWKSFMILGSFKIESSTS